MNPHQFNNAHLESYLMLTAQVTFAMGAVISYFGYSQHQQPQMSSSPISIIDLLDRELQIARIENAEKDAFIRSLLHSSVTSFNCHRDSQTKGETLTENLIDLSDCSQESESTKVGEEDGILVDILSEDISETGEVQNETLNPSLNQSFESDSEESSYIIRFIDPDTTFPEVQSQPETSVSERAECERRSESVTPARSIELVLPEPDTHKQVEPDSTISSKLHNVSNKDNVAGIEPRWMVSEIFSSVRQHESAVYLNRSHAGPDELRFPDFFGYGIRFCPGEKDNGVYRTVVVSNLPPHIQLGTLLNRVRGGLVIDAKLLDTVQITGKKSALIIFLSEYAALAFEDHSKEYPLIISGVEARVQVVRVSLERIWVRTENTNNE